MPDTVDDVPGPSKVDGLLPVTGERFSSPGSEKFDKRPTVSSSDCEEVAARRFAQIRDDYAHARMIYSDTAMKGRGSRRLDGMPCILWDLAAFMKWVEAEAERVAFEVKITRQNKQQQDYWAALKRAFYAELDRIRHHT